MCDLTIVAIGLASNKIVFLYNSNTINSTRYVPGCSSSTIGGMAEALLVVQRIPLAKYLKRVKVARQNIELAGIFKSLLKSLVFKIRQAAPCFVCNLDMWIGLPADGSMEIFATGHVVKEAPSSSLEIISSRRHMSSIKESPAPCMFPRALADRVENQARRLLKNLSLVIKVMRRQVNSR